jgi:hypothetical protein
LFGKELTKDKLLEELKKKRNIVGLSSLTKGDLLKLLNNESCDYSAERFCSDKNQICDTKYNVCSNPDDFILKGKRKIEEFNYKGHRIIGDSKLIEELKRKLSGAGSGSGSGGGGGGRLAARASSCTAATASSSSISSDGTQR